MKKTIYYTTTALIVSCGIAKAQTCVPTPTCSTLGYTSTTACDGGIKCPFGEAWNCSVNNIRTEITEKITELTNKINELEGKIENNQQENGDCSIGAILYSDKTCSNMITTEKTPIGVVVYSDGSGHGQAIAIENVDGSFFSTKKSYVYGLGVYVCTVTAEAPTDFPVKSTEAEAIMDFDSCENTAKLVAAGSNFDAAQAIHEYSTSGTSGGDWCMPAAGILNYINQNLQIINNTLKILGAEEFSESLSSSMASNNYYWYMNGGLSKGTIISVSYPSGASECFVDGTEKTRPVIEF